MYHTLLVKWDADGDWGIEFGAWDKDDVDDELDSLNDSDSPPCDAKILTNAHMPNKLVKKHCALDGHAEAILEQSMQELALSARAYTKILKVARTIADIEAAPDINVEHISEAIQYRSLDRGLWR